MKKAKSALPKPHLTPPLSKGRPGGVIEQKPVIYYVYCQHKWNRSSAQITSDVCLARQERVPKKCAGCRHLKGSNEHHFADAGK